MTDTRDQFHERESQVAPPVRSGEIAHTPWTAEYHSRPSDGWRIINSLGDRVCQGAHSMFDERDFPLIVCAVNSHADMLAALKIFLGDDDRFQVAVGGNPLAVDRMLDGIRALVDKAEGRS